jgi:hypothetical protein
VFEAPQAIDVVAHTGRQHLDGDVTVEARIAR